MDRRRDFIIIECAKCGKEIIEDDYEVIDELPYHWECIEKMIEEDEI